MELQKPLELIFSFNTLSYLQQRIFNVLIWFAFDESRSSPFGGNHFIKLSLIKNKMHTSIGDTNDFYLRNTIKDILKSKYSYNILKIKNKSSQTLNKSLFSQIKIENNIVRYSLDEDFKLYFQDEDEYVSLNIQNFSFIKSKYSLKLYELSYALMHKNIKKIPLEIFKNLLGISKTYSDITSLKKRVLNIAQVEICKYTDICVGYFIDIRENMVFLYPKRKEESQAIMQYINNMFLGAYLLYKDKKYLYQNIYLSQDDFSFCLNILSVKHKKDFIIRKNSIEELKLFVQKHILIS